MSNISNCLRLSQISMPGTHDTMALYGLDYAATQTWSLREQLDAGIRFLDIRARAEDGVLQIFHGDFYQYATFDDVMAGVDGFLADNPSETVLMRLTKENGVALYDTTGGRWDLFQRAFLGHMGTWGHRMYSRGTLDPWMPTLGQVRGKVVLLRDIADAQFDDPSYAHYGVSLQEHSRTPSPRFDYANDWALYEKWEDTKSSLLTTDAQNRTYLHITALAQGYPLQPYFAASGHSDPRTEAPRRATGSTVTGGFNADLWPDFPRVGCGGSTCTIAFEGINELAMNYINNRTITFAGIVSADFPGTGLIQSIIELNPITSNQFPVIPELPNLQVNRGMPITLSAPVPHDPQGNALTYRWKFNFNTGDVMSTPEGTMPSSWDTDWSLSPTVTRTYSQPGVFNVAVGISDGCAATFRVFSVTVLPDPLAPTLRVANGAAEVLTNTPVTVEGLWIQPHHLSAYQVVIDWPNNIRPRTQTLVTSDHIVESVTFTEPGDYTITMTVSEYGGTDVGTTSTVVRVVAPPPPPNTAPVLFPQSTSTPSANISRATSNPSGTTVTFTALAEDAEDGALPAVCVPASGSTFPIGSTTVSCTVTDAGGLTASGTFIVTVALVTNNTPPKLRGLLDYKVRATGDSGAQVAFSVTGSDKEDGLLPGVCSHQSGQVFPSGRTIVTCTVTDSGGAASTATFRVTVVANERPKVRILDVVKPAAGASSRAVSFRVTASDREDGDLAVSCSHPSGASFAIGRTVVTCSATDSYGATASASFVVKISP